MVEQQEEIELRLRANGVKPTNQRMEIGRLLLATPQHLSAEQILSQLQAQGSRVSKATVYNTLKLFTQHGLAREVSVDATRQFFDSTTHHHHHFYNVDTGALTDIPSDQLRFSHLPELPQGTEATDIEVIVKVRNRA